jgi:hypothetical protein
VSDFVRFASNNRLEDRRVRGLVSPTVIYQPRSSAKFQPLRCVLHFSYAISCRRHVEMMLSLRIKHGLAFRTTVSRTWRPFTSTRTGSLTTSVGTRSEEEEENVYLTASRSLIQRLDPEDRRPMTMLERMRFFMVGTNKLLLDFQRYRNIHDASRTRLNAWTINHPLRKQDKGVFNRISDQSEIDPRPGRMPWRQYEQQRRIQTDRLSLLPVVFLSMVPIIGYIPLILAVSAPRQILSRHFYNQYEVYFYNELEYQQRKNHFEPVYKLFLQSGKLDTFNRSIHWKGDDEAGPILDLFAFFSPLLAPGGSSFDNNQLFVLDSFQRTYIIELALAIGIHQHLPPWASTKITALSPTRLLRFQILQKIRIVTKDDTLLLQEQHHKYGCESLTDTEVMDACLMRGLPVNISAENMRVCLTNHLNMIAALRDCISHDALKSESFALLTVHLPILRQVIKSNEENQSALA